MTTRKDNLKLKATLLFYLVFPHLMIDKSVCIPIMYNIIVIFVISLIMLILEVEFILIRKLILSLEQPVSYIVLSLV